MSAKKNPPSIWVFLRRRAATEIQGMKANLEAALYGLPAVIYVAMEIEPTDFEVTFCQLLQLLTGMEYYYVEGPHLGIEIISINNSLIYSTVKACL